MRSQTSRSRGSLAVLKAGGCSGWRMVAVVGEIREVSYWGVKDPENLAEECVFLIQLIIGKHCRLLNTAKVCVV